MIYVSAASLEDMWGKSIQAVLENGEKQAYILELCNLFIECSNVDVISEDIMKFNKEIMGEKYWERTECLYTTTKNLRWKESYLGRLINWDNKYNQLEEVIKRAKKAPSSKTLWCTLLHPKDLRRAHAIPACVPCPISFGIKIRNLLLSLEVIFRSQDVVRLGLADIFYFSKMQKDFIHQILISKGKEDNSETMKGSLIFYISSAFIRNEDKQIAEKIINSLQ